MLRSALLTTGLCATGLIAAATPAAEATAVVLDGAPVLTVAVRDRPATSTAPAAWVTLTTTRRLPNPRLVVVRVHATSGRTFRADPPSTCLRSTIVTDDGRIAIRPGRRYVVRVSVREGIGRSRPKTLVATRTVTARGLRVGAEDRARPPRCASRHR